MLEIWIWIITLHHAHNYTVDYDLPSNLQWGFVFLSEDKENHKFHNNYDTEVMETFVSFINNPVMVSRDAVV